MHSTLAGRAARRASADGGRSLVPALRIASANRRSGFSLTPHSKTGLPAHLLLWLAQSAHDRTVIYCRDIPSRARKVSLTMIVRDEETNLPNCLESVRGLFDEIIVLDTGSKDRTVEIARSFGARVFDFVWVDDFAAARNAALARAKGDYAFWLDADDVIEPPERAKLEELFGRLHMQRETTAYVLRCACDPGPNGEGGDTVVDHIRLFPVIEGVRWTYRVHEQILPALKRAGVPVEWTKITVRHTGYADRALRARKLERDSRILREELAERPDDPFTLFNLGSIAIERTEWNEALGYLQAQPGALGTDGFDHPEAVCPDCEGTPDAGGFPGGDGDLCRRAFVRRGGCRAVVSQGGRAPACRPASGSRGMLAADFDADRGPRSLPAWTRGFMGT